MLDFTVAICTYNGEERLPAVFERLLSQVNTETLSWEILVIDNNSKDGTKALVEKYQKTWEQPFKLRYSFESRQGLAYARHCGIKEANSELIGFLDDDNLPAPGWVVQAYQFGREHPKAGAYGGQIHGQFENEPPPGFERIARYFAILEGQTTYCYNERYGNTRQKMFPPGAGIVVRKQAWLNSVPDKPRLPQTNEDLEILWYLWHNNWELWFNSAMEIDHVIPQSRFESAYLRKFFHTNGLCRFYFRMLTYEPWQRPFMIPVYWLNDLRKFLTFYWKNKDILQTDIVTAGEMELLRSLLISPFQSFNK
ncbi:MAG: hormogonium polysaccharide biosynthesis glycosyltransferase HpsE [Microcystaceae cyanobacterium]